MTFEYVQTFFKSNEKEKLRDPAPGSLHVRQVGVEIMEQSSNSKYPDKQGNTVVQKSGANRMLSRCLIVFVRR